MKESVFGMNLVGPQGVNETNDFALGKNENGEPCMKFGDREFTPNDIGGSEAKWIDYTEYDGQDVLMCYTRMYVEATSHADYIDGTFYPMVIDGYPRANIACEETAGHANVHFDSFENPFSESEFSVNGFIYVESEWYTFGTSDVTTYFEQFPPVLKYLVK